VLLTVGAFVVVIGVLIFVHEAGHFLVAKATGVQVLRFSLGFGKPLVRVRRGETEYWISALPLGGYVKMAGLEDEGMVGSIEGGHAETPVDPARAFDRRPLLVRIAVILAGVTMNMLFAVFAYAGLFGTLGEARLATTQVDSVWTDSLPSSARALATLRRGDQIVAVNQDSVTSWEDLLERLATAPLPLRLRVAGRTDALVLALPRGDVQARAAVLRSVEPFVPPVLDTVQPGLPGARGGLARGDRVLRVGSDTIVSWAQFTRRVRASAHRRLTVVVARGDSIVTLVVTPERRPVPDPRTGEVAMSGYLGIGPVQPVVRTRFGVAGAVGAGLRRALRDAGQVAGTVRGLVTGQVSLKEVGGPIMIGRISGQAARRGVPDLLAFMALLSVNLAVLNLLPIPILDGGQLVFLIAEGLRRRPLSLRLRLVLTQIVFALIVSVMAIVVGREFLGLFGR